jgi:hypothetical protein
MSDLLSRLKLGSDNIKLVDFPNINNQKIALRILSQKEIQEASFATERHFKSEKIELNMVTASDYDTEKSVQMLFRALRDPEKLQESISATITEFRSLLTRQEISALADEYLAFESECSPSLDTLSGDEFDKLVSDLKKKPEQTIGNITSLQMLRRLLLTMVKQPVKSLTDNG